MANRAQRDCPPRRCTLRAAMTRLGRVISGPDVLYRGIWPTYFSAPFGIAAVAARLLQLDANQTAHALALALTLARARRRPPQRSDHVAFHVALVRRRQRRPQRIDRRPCGAIRLHIRPWASGLGLLRQCLRHRAQPVGVDGRLGRRASRSRRNPAPTSGASSMFPETRIARSTGYGSRTNSAAWSLLCLRANSERHGQANCRKPGRPPIADAVGRRGESALRARSRRFVKPIPDRRWHSHEQTASSP